MGVCLCYNFTVRQFAKIMGCLPQQSGREEVGEKTEGIKKKQRSSSWKGWQDHSHLCFLLTFNTSASDSEP